MANYSLITCSEEHGTISESVEEESTKCSVTLRVPWNYRTALISDLLENRWPWPHFSAWPNPPRAKSCACVPDKTSYAASGQVIGYQDALVTVQYSTDGIDLLSESIEPNVEFMVLDHKRFRWDEAEGDPLLEGEAPGKQLYSLNLSRQIFKVTPPLPMSLLELPGCCNKEAYTSILLGLTFEKETLLFQPPVLSRTIKSNGDLRFTVALKFSFRPDGWNTYWRAKTQEYAEIWDVDGTARHENYPPDDFSDFLY